MSRGIVGLEAVVMLALVPVAVVANGIAISVLWGWFIAPLGVMEIGAAHGIGISTAVGLIHSSDSPVTKENQEPWIVMITVLLRPLFAVCFGWLALQFM